MLRKNAIRTKGVACPALALLICMIAVFFATPVMAATITLPAGSTGTDLQTAIDNAVSDDVIEIAGDMSFDHTVRIPEGKKITVQSDSGNNWTCTNDFGDFFEVRNSSLILNNITLDGQVKNRAISVLSEGNLTINDGVIVQNCYSGYGAIDVDLGGALIMNGGVIRDNRAGGNDPGSGVSVNNHSTFTMNGGTIRGNSTIAGSGAGVAVKYFSHFVMTGGTITGNVSANDGGGIYVDTTATATISGTSAITNNSAPNGDGGGIDTFDATYRNLTIGSSVVFRCNTAETAYAPPTNAATLYPNIQFASTSITSHPLNNYDINYTDSEPMPIVYQITYHANGGTGSYIGPEIEPDKTDIVLSLAETGISREGHTFTDWNSEPDGSGKSYAPGDEITVNCNITLYAQWQESVAETGEHIWYVCGYPDGSFRPNANITRAEAATIFYRLKIAGATTTSTISEFSDVSEGAWYYEAVMYLARQNLVDGYGDGTFRPDANITRAEFATLAARYDELDLSEENPFPDVNGHWAEDYIASAVNKGWLEGYPNGTFRPDNDISRAEAVTLVNNVFDRRIQLTDIPEDVPHYTDLTESHWAYAAIIEASVTHKFERKDDGYEIWLTWGN